MSWNDFGNDQPLPEIEPLPRPKIDSEIVIKRQQPDFAPPQTESPDRFAPMPKATLLPQVIPTPAAQLPKQIAARLSESIQPTPAPTCGVRLQFSIFKLCPLSGKSGSANYKLKHYKPRRKTWNVNDLQLCRKSVL